MNHGILRCVVLPPQQTDKNSRPLKLGEYSLQVPSGSPSAGHMWVLSEKLGYVISVTGQVLVWDVLRNLAPIMDASLTWRNCTLICQVGSQCQLLCWYDFLVEMEIIALGWGVFLLVI